MGNSLGCVKLLGPVPSIITSGLFLGSLYSLVTVGLSTLWGVGRTVNLAHGNFMILGAYIALFLFTSAGISPLITIIIAGAILAAIGAGLYQTLFSRTVEMEMSRERRELMTLLLTFAMILIVSNALALAFTPNFRSYSFMEGGLSLGLISIQIPRGITIIVSLLVLVGYWLFINKTWYGLAIKSVRDDMEAAELQGINSRKALLVVFGIGFATVGIAGVLFSMVYTLTPYLGLKYLMIGFVGTTLGGVGSVKGALAGGMIVGFIEAIGMTFLSPLLRPSIIFGMFVIVLLLKPKGLFREM